MIYMSMTNAGFLLEVAVISPKNHFVSAVARPLIPVLGNNSQLIAGLRYHVRL